MFSPIIEKLIKLFSKFPTVGPRTAARFVFYLIKRPENEIKEIVETILELKNKIGLCSECFAPFEKKEKENICPICSDKTRNNSLICVVEKEVDLQAIEKTKKFKGRYFILGGSFFELKSEKEKKEIKRRVEKLIERIKNNPEIKEVILALNPTTEGEATSLWLERKLKPLKIKITHLGKGLPVGGELEYADEETLSSALENRREKPLG